MTKLIQVDDDLWVRPSLVAAVKRFDEGKCTVFIAGQSAVDGGFLIDRDADSVVEDVNAGPLAAEEEG